MRYAAYGSNLHPARLGERVPSATLLGQAVVLDRTLQFHKRSKDGSGKCNITTGEDRVYVAVYEIAPHDKAKLDQIEGLGIGYRVEFLDVPNHGECFTYVATDTHIDESLKPYSWYKELVVAGSEYLQFPRQYVEWIAAFQSWNDPDHQRHAEHMNIVRRARTETNFAR